MNKEKALQKHKRTSKKSLKRRKHRKQYLKMKNAQTQKKKKIVYKKYRPKMSLWARIRMIPLAIKTLIGKLKCKTGLHSWTLHSGLKGTPKFMCRHCQKLSKVMW